MRLIDADKLKKHDYRTTYCYDCGAKMDGEGETK